MPRAFHGLVARLVLVVRDGLCRPLRCHAIERVAPWFIDRRGGRVTQILTVPVLMHHGVMMAVDVVHTDTHKRRLF